MKLALNQITIAQHTCSFGFFCEEVDTLWDHLLTSNRLSKAGNKHFKAFSSNVWMLKSICDPTPQKVKQEWELTAFIWVVFGMNNGTKTAEYHKTIGSCKDVPSWKNTDGSFPQGPFDKKIIFHSSEIFRQQAIRGSKPKDGSWGKWVQGGEP